MLAMKEMAFVSSYYTNINGLSNGRQCFSESKMEDGALIKDPTMSCLKKYAGWQNKHSKHRPWALALFGCIFFLWPFFSRGKLPVWSFIVSLCSFQKRQLSLPVSCLFPKRLTSPCWR
jgi:hypothetical protein